jgi:hypothetical protein
VLFHSIDGFLQAVEYISAIFRIKSLSIYSAKYLLGKKYFLQKNNENLLVATEKTGHEVNTEKPERMFISCKENVEVYHNIKVNNRFFVWA